MDKGNERIVIYPKDDQRLTAKGEKYSREILEKIKQWKTKEKHQFVSIEVFAEFTGLSVDQIMQHLSN